MDLIFELNGKIVNPPRNWKALDIELSFDNDNPSASLSANSFEFVGEEAILINDYIRDGRTTGLGILEGICFNVYFFCDGVRTIILQSVLDLASSEAEFTCDIVKTPIREIDKIDFLNETADSFGMSFLHKGIPTTQAGHVTRNDFVNIKYTLADIPDGLATAMAALSVYILVTDLLNLNDKVADTASDAVNASVPDVGTGAGFGAVVTVDWNFASIATALFKIILEIAYFALFLAALVILIKQLIESLFTFIRIHKGMKAKTIFERGCEYLGYTFKSSIFQGGDYDNMVIIPPKAEVGVLNDFINKSKEVGYEDNETFGDFLRSMIDMFNGKIRIVGNELQFERRDFFLNPAPFTIPDVELEFNGTNASEIASNYFLQYSFDTTDLHSFEDFTGQNIQNTVTAKNVFTTDRRLSKTLLKNLTRKDLKYSHVRRKEQVSTLEKILATLASIATNILSAVGGGSPQGLKSANLKGVWLTQSHFSNVPRVAILDNSGKISSISRSVLRADKLYDDFHFIESPVSSTKFPLPNQYLTFKSITIPLCCEDFRVLQGNNVVTTQDGRIAVVESLKYNIFKQTALIDFKINEIYTNNLQETKIIDGKN